MSETISQFLTDYDLYLFAHGTHYKLFDKLGAHITEINGKRGVHFAVWAPNAERISVIGEFNGWKEGKHEMNRINEAGVWTLFIPVIQENYTYKYSIKSKVDGFYRRKTDPYAFRSELRPKNASIVHDIDKYKWNDNEWMNNRYKLFKQHGWERTPINIYELHLGSWKKDYNNIDYPNEWGFKNYRQLAYEIVDYVKQMGYTHIELLPVMEHPLDISWGYQVTNYFSPTSRYGLPEDFMFFVDYCHMHDIGVILDWVPAHFPSDEHALGFYDGKQIYAYESWKKGFQKDWGTYIFDFGRNEVQNFLISSALFWIDKYHADGLRVDAVASMLYLDYSREHGEWEPNIHGGRENLESVNFIKHLNSIIHQNHPDVLTIAEESTAWAGVSHKTEQGGLGFSMKWNMGWMNDILLYFSKEPVHRKYHHGKLTFSLWYAFNENFVLPLSHDEVVHSKGSLIEKMPGDNWQKFANLRLMLGFMFGHPGKKLNFMTNDVAQYKEWNPESQIGWELLKLDLNKQLNTFVKDLNHLYLKHPAMYEVDFKSYGFKWIDFSDAQQSVIAFLRYSEDEIETLMFTFNMTPVVREHYRIGVPKDGIYKEIMNSDAAQYGGSGVGNMGGVHASYTAYHGFPYSVELTLPPLAFNIFQLEEPETAEDVSGFGD